jgi:hypothetical protein
MAVVDVLFRERRDGYVCLQTLTATEILAGDSVTVAGVGEGMDGTFTVLDITPYGFQGVDAEGDFDFDYSVFRENQIIYRDAGDDVERDVTTAGTVTYSPTVTWIASGDVITWLGVEPANANDVEYLSSAVAASNAFCYRKRREAGYSDQTSVVPDAAVKQGTILYAAMLYRERGAVDGFASFDSFNTAAPTLSLSRVMQLLGCGRPQVG